MFELSTSLSPADLVREPNIAELLPPDDRVKLAQLIFQEWELDKQSRSDWEDRMANAMDLALLVRKQKSFPWQGCSNVKFPLVTVAALQHHALIYPALLPQADLVKCRVIGPDSDGQKWSRAQRVEAHMSYQLLEEDEGWEEDMDRALIVQPIMGCAFKKTYYCRKSRGIKSEFVSPAELYLPYYTRSVAESPRVTHLLQMDRNDALGLMREGLYCEYDLHPPRLSEEERLTIEAQKAQGLRPSGSDPDRPLDLLEQHRWLDLDGDGFLEPYIAIVRRDTRELYRLVARYSAQSVEKVRGQIVRIYADQYFTKYSFIPSPDGGIYDLGWGALLSPLSESIDSIINQSIDSGTLSIVAGGFLGRGARLKSGDNQFRPGEWKVLQGSSDDLRKHVYPYPAKDIPPFMFSLLSLLINYGERLVGATDPAVGENPGQNTPAETSRTMVREARKIYNGIYKRTWRALRDEMRLVFRQNSLFMPETGSPDYAGEIARSDYSLSPKAIVPAADPQMISDVERVQLAVALKQNAMQTPGYDLPAVERRFLAAMRVPNPQEIYRPEEIAPTPSPLVQAEQMKLQIAQLRMEAELRKTLATLLSQVDLNRAQIANLESQAVLNFAKADATAGNQRVAMLNAQINAAKHHQEGLLKAVQIYEAQLTELARLSNEERKETLSEPKTVPERPALPSPGGSLGSVAEAA